jgi:hypothetical protein
VFYIFCDIAFTDVAFDDLSSLWKLLKEYYLYIFMETSIENGVQKGDVVEVVRGRKVKKGTVGVVTNVIEREMFESINTRVFYENCHNSRMLRELPVVMERIAAVETSDGNIVAVKEDYLVVAGHVEVKA